MPDESSGGQAPGAGPHRSLEVCGIEVNTETTGPLSGEVPTELGSQGEKTDCCLKSLSKVGCYGRRQGSPVPKL